MPAKRKPPKPTDLPIKKLIDKYDLTHAQLASKVGARDNQISVWCSGRQKVNTRVTIEICRQFPEYRPSDFNPKFPKDLTCNFTKSK